MAKKTKKKKKSRAGAQKKEIRLAQAKNWLPTCEGTKIVKAYRKKFHVDVSSAVRDLQEIGYEFKPGYAENLLKSETVRIEANRRKKADKRPSGEYNDFQDDNFFFIAGYTSGGAPYGVTWDDMGMEPWEDGFGDDDEDWDDEASEGTGAVCPVCKSNILTADGCKPYALICDGNRYARIKVGCAEDFYEDANEDTRCDDCGAKYGHFHHRGCDCEHCPICGGQLISCGCDFRIG